MESDPGSPAEALDVRPRRWVRWLWLLPLLVVVTAGVWWVSHPEELPADAARVEAATKVGTPIYLGVVDATGQGRRNLDIDSVDVEVLSPEEHSALEVEALICKDGSVGQTTDPSRFCAQVLPAAGNALYLGGGDQLLLSVESSRPGTVEIGRVELTFHEGLQRGTAPVGPTYRVQVLGGSS